MPIQLCQWRLVYRDPNCKTDCECGGWIKPDGTCGKCGRSLDLKRERRVAERQRKQFENRQCYQSQNKERRVLNG